MTLRDAIGRLRSLRDPTTTAMASVEALNRRDWPHLRQLLDEDFFYVDKDDNRIDKPDRFMSSLRAMLKDAPDFMLDVESYEHAGRMVYMRGRTVSENYRFRSESLWRARVKRGKLSCLENFGGPGAGRLARYRDAG